MYVPIFLRSIVKTKDQSEFILFKFYLLYMKIQRLTEFVLKREKKKLNLLDTTKGIYSKSIALNQRYT